MLGFGLPGFGLSIDNGGGDIDNDNNNPSGNIGNTGSNSNARRVVVGGFCKNCNVVCYILFDSPLGRMCKSCHTHWRRTGNRRPISGPDSIAPTKRSTHNSAAAADRSKRKPPRGMYINHDDLTALAGCKNPCEYLAEGDRKIAALMAEVRNIQKNRQMMEQLEKDCSDGNVDVDSGSTGAQKTTPSSTETAAAAQPRISARWTSDEIEVALLALRDYGKNFPMIAKVVGTKTEAHVRTFYVSNRRRYNLDQIVKEYEAKSEDSNIEEQCDAAPAAGAAATTATAATAAAGNLMEGSKSETSDATSQELAKKEEPMANANSTASSNSNNNTTKKKPELMNAAIAALKSSECASSTAVAPLAAALAAATASGTASVNKAATLAIGAPTITIVDESDTATSSSSDLANSNNNMAPAAGSNSVSSLSGISSSNSSSSSSAAPAKSSTNNNHNDADSEESLSLKSSAHVPVKRDNSDLNTGELPPAKKMALAVGAEFLAK
nr:REST corepressor isoform X4 [Drosophila virilis]